MERAVGYVRVSTQEQATNGASLDAQRDAIEAESARRGWDLVAIEADEGVSAKSMKKRHGLERALRAVEKGKADVLLVSRLDRLSRSVIDFAMLVERSRRRGWRIAVLDMDIDTTTPNGELVAGILAQVAQWERRLIGQRTQEALAVKKAQGVRLGRPTTVAPDVIERIEALRSGGSTLAAIADALNDDHVPTAQGGTQWWPATVRKVLERVNT